MIAGYMKKDAEATYGLLKVARSGRRFIKSPHSFMVVTRHRVQEDEYED